MSRILGGIVYLKFTHRSNCFIDRVSMASTVVHSSEPYIAGSDAMPIVLATLDKQILRHMKKGRSTNFKILPGLHDTLIR